MDKKIKVVRVRNERGQTEDDGFISYTLCDLSLPGAKTGSSEDYILSNGERLLSHSFVMDTMRKLMGRTLTILDASISDREQKKALKDLIRNIYSDEMDFSARWAFDQSVIEALIPDDLTETEIAGSAISIEQALGVK